MGGCVSFSATDRTPLALCIPLFFLGVVCDASVTQRLLSHPSPSLASPCFTCESQTEKGCDALTDTDDSFSFSFSFSFSLSLSLSLSFSFSFFFEQALCDAKQNNKNGIDFGVVAFGRTGPPHICSSELIPTSLRPPCHFGFKMPNWGTSLLYYLSRKMRSAAPSACSVTDAWIVHALWSTLRDIGCVHRDLSLNNILIKKRKVEVANASSLVRVCVVRGVGVFEGGGFFLPFLSFFLSFFFFRSVSLFLLGGWGEWSFLCWSMTRFSKGKRCFLLLMFLSFSPLDKRQDVVKPLGKEQLELHFIDFAQSLPCSPEQEAIVRWKQSSDALSASLQSIRTVGTVYIVPTHMLLFTTDLYEMVAITEIDTKDHANPPRKTTVGFKIVECAVPEASLSPELYPIRNRMWAHANSQTSVDAFAGSLSVMYTLFGLFCNLWDSEDISKALQCKDIQLCFLDKKTEKVYHKHFDASCFQELSSFLRFHVSHALFQYMMLLTEQDMKDIHVQKNAYLKGLVHNHDTAPNTPEQALRQKEKQQQRLKDRERLTSVLRQILERVLLRNGKHKMGNTCVHQVWNKNCVKNLFVLLTEFFLSLDGPQDQAWFTLWRFPVIDQRSQLFRCSSPSSGPAPLQHKCIAKVSFLTQTSNGWWRVLLKAFQKGDVPQRSLGEHLEKELKEKIKTLPESEKEDVEAAFRTAWKVIASPWSEMQETWDKERERW
mmetsp:Transcript_5897/g.14068  ORF Transcript_5897/g.14068 Transcript_5897/m.14068 type:complete len:716 (+) Transcript_5897:940-3087(+)